MQISDKLLIEVFYLAGGEEPLICGVNGKITTHCLCEIEDELTGDDPYDFDKGEGSYFFAVFRESAQTGEFGMVEIPAYWNFTFVRYEPIPEEDIH